MLDQPSVAHGGVGKSSRLSAASTRCAITACDVFCPRGLSIITGFRLVVSRRRPQGCNGVLECQSLGLGSRQAAVELAYARTFIEIGLPIFRIDRNGLRLCDTCDVCDRLGLAIFDVCLC